MQIKAGNRALLDKDNKRRIKGGGKKARGEKEVKGQTTEQIAADQTDRSVTGAVGNQGFGPRS